LKRIFYADDYTKRIADEIAKSYDITAELFRIHNPTFKIWISWMKKRGKNTATERLPPGSMLIGGNRWRHHYALDLTGLPTVSIDAHTDMNYDEMIPLRLVRPYNWLYFRLLQGCETHLVLPYSNFRGGRWNIVIPEKHFGRFHLYSFDKKKSETEVSLSLRQSKTVEIRNVEISPPIPKVNKQISLDWDVTREVKEETIEQLLTRIAGEGDVCDVWLDEGKRWKRNTLKDHVQYCLKIYEALNGLRISG
jgi:hypothetical protein